MGTLIASTLIDRAVVAIMNDKNKVRFTAARGLEWLNEAQRYFVGVNPSANSSVVVVTLTAGTRQTVPANAHQLIAPRYNCDVNNIPGRAITPATTQMLNAPDPNWRLRALSGTIRHVIAEDQIPGEFEVFPPALASTKIALELALIPPVLGANDPITFDDTYESALIDYMLSRFYQKDAEYAGNADLAQRYFMSVQGKLSMKSQSDAANSMESRATREAA